MEKLKKATQKAHTSKQPYAVYGHRITPKKGDHRNLEYRIHHENGKPTALEIYLVTRDADWNPKQVKTLKYSF